MMELGALSESPAAQLAAVDAWREEQLGASPRGQPPEREWDVVRMEREMRAALDAAAVAQRTAVEAEEMAAAQQAAFSVQMQKERQRLHDAHQREMSQLWAQWAGVEPEELGVGEAVEP